MGILIVFSGFPGIGSSKNSRSAIKVKSLISTFSPCFLKVLLIKSSRTFKTPHGIVRQFTKAIFIPKQGGDKESFTIEEGEVFSSLFLFATKKDTALSQRSVSELFTIYNKNITDYLIVKVTLKIKLIFELKNFILYSYGKWI